MSYIKLEVRSGGIYIKQKKDFQEIKLNLTPHPEDSSQKVLLLVQDSSIKGLFSYLIGETGKINEIEDSQETSIKKLNLTLNKIVQSSVYKKVSEPYVTTFFERRDVHKKNFISPPSISLYKYSISEAEQTIKNLEKPLKNIMTDPISSLSDVYSFFKKHEIKSTESEYEKLREYILKHLKKYSNDSNCEKTKNIIKEWKKVWEEKFLNKKNYSNLKSNMQVILKKHFCRIMPDNQKIIKGFLTALDKIIDQKPISSKVPVLIEEIYNLYNKNIAFSKEIKSWNSFQFSSFTNLRQTKAWVDKKYHPIVRGAPAYIACVDFDVYLSKSAFEESEESDYFNWDDIIKKLQNGPNIARWGEGGIVLIDYKGLDEMSCPHEHSDKIFVEIKALRRGRLKN